jgi:release factor glutamine methyltransferase
MSATDAGAARVWTVLELLRWTQGHFQGRGIETARLDAECLLAHALGCDRLRLYLEYDKPVQAAERQRFRELVKRRADTRVPVAQLTGTREFWSLPFEVSPDVLVPRPETESLVEEALVRLPDPEAAASVLDVGTGSGAVAIAIARERPKARVVATDLSEAALAVARRNAEALGVADRLHLAAGDLFAAAPGAFDLVVSNPPYLALGEAEGLAPELAHEPRAALFAGPDGRELLRRLVDEAPAHLAPGGALALEIAPGQAGDVRQWLEERGFRGARVRRDLAGRPRVVSGRLAPDAPGALGGPGQGGSQDGEPVE